MFFFKSLASPSHALNSICQTHKCKCNLTSSPHAACLAFLLASAGWLSRSFADCSLSLSLRPVDCPVTVLRLSSAILRSVLAESSVESSTGRCASTCAARTVPCRPVAGVSRPVWNRYLLLSWPLTLDPSKQFISTETNTEVKYKRTIEINMDPNAQRGVS